jgi:hypothetical protein
MNSNQTVTTRHTIRLPAEAMQVAGSATFSIPAPDSATRESHVDAELSLLAQAAHVLATVVEQLEERLDRVCSPIEPRDHTEPASIEAWRVPVAESIRMDRRSIDESYQRLCSIRDRLEL